MLLSQSFAESNGWFGRELWLRCHWRVRRSWAGARLASRQAARQARDVPETVMGGSRCPHRSPQDDTGGLRQGPLAGQSRASLARHVTRSTKVVRK